MTDKLDVIGKENIGAVSRKMTQQEQFTAVVQAGMDGGFTNYIRDCKPLRVFKHPDNCIWYIVIGRDDENYEFSLPELICNGSFMDAAMGEHCKFIDNHKECKSSSEDCFKYNEYPIYDCFETASTYYAHQALDLLLTGGDAIKYLYDNLPEVKG